MHHKKSYDMLADGAEDTTPLQFSPAPTRVNSTDEGVRLLHPQPKGGRLRDVAEGTLNLVNTIIGGGMLALPFAIRNCGVAFGALLVIVFFLLSWYTGRLIVTCAMPPLSGGLTYAQLAHTAFGSAGRAFVDVCMILFVLGACVGYLVIIGDVLTPYINFLFACDRRLVMLFFGGLVCFPLSCLRRISFLKYTSLAALVFIFYLVMCIVVSSIIDMGRPQFDPQRIVVFSLDAQFLAVLPIISFAFTFHTNVPPIWSDMREFPNASANINTSIFISCAICAVVYLACGIFGYLSFFDATSDNILTHYDALVAWYFDIGKIGYSLIIMFSYPLLAFPLRTALDGLINVYYFKNEKLEVSTLRLILEAAGIFVVSYVLAILPIGIGVVFGITGATMGNLLVTGLPCLFYITLDVDATENVGPRPWWYYRIFSRRKAVPLALFVLSLILTVLGLFSVIAYSILPGWQVGADK